MAMSGDDFERRFDVVADTRRRWSLAEKRRIVEEASAPCTNVSAVARRHGTKPALLYRWKKELASGTSEAATLLPVTMTPEPEAEDDHEPRAGLPASASPLVEIELSNGKRPTNDLGLAALVFA